jgi:hypothetical protein
MATCVATSGPVNAVWKLSRGLCVMSVVDPEDGGSIFILNFRVNLLRLDLQGLTVPKHFLIREECVYWSVPVCSFYR